MFIYITHRLIEFCLPHFILFLVGVINLADNENLGPTFSTMTIDSLSIQICSISHAFVYLFQHEIEAINFRNCYIISGLALNIVDFLWKPNILFLSLNQSKIFH